MKIKKISTTILLAMGMVFTGSIGHAQMAKQDTKGYKVASVVTCGTDTVAYPQSKATGTSAVELIKNHVHGIAQWYELPAAATMKGITLIAGVKDGANTGKTATVSIKIYGAGADSLPQLIPLSATTVQLDNSVRAQRVPLLSPLSLTGNYLVSVEYGAALLENDTIQLQLNSAGDGNGESLGAGIFHTNSGDVWLDFEHLIPSPDRDAMLFPWINYSLTTDFGTPGDSVCVDESLQITNNTTEFAMSRMYNRRIQSPAQYGNAFSWNFGDGTTSTDLEPLKLYTVTGPFSILLTAAITGYNTQCSEPMAAPIVTMPRPYANFSTGSHIASVNDTITIVSMGSGGECSWDFGDGSPIVIGCNDQMHAFDSVGTYNIVQTVTSPYGCTETHTETVFIQSPLAVADPQASLGVSVWPNPISRGNETLHVTWKNSDSPATVQVIDLQGRILAMRKVSGLSSCEIALQELPQGVLILQVFQNGMQYNRRVSVLN